MRLRALRIDQFRKFDRPMRLADLRDGVNVLCAPNEFGKSTLLAAIRAVLFERHTSRTAPIRSYQPRLGSAAPSIALSFEHAGALHRIEKRFMLRPKATLVSGSATFEADAAEERLATLLGVSATGRGARDAARQAASIWEALLVDQGESFSQAAFGDEARSTLSDCLQAELGAVSGGVAIARLLRPVQAQLAERLDGHGRPRDRYKAAIADEAAAAAEAAILVERRRTLLDDLSALQAARRALAQNSDPQADAAARAALSEARRERDALLGQRDRVGQATAAVELAGNDLAALRAELDRRGALSEAAAGNARLLQRLRQDETDAGRRLADAMAALERGRAAQQEAQRVADGAVRALRLARARQDDADRGRRHAVLRDRLDQAEHLSGRIAALAARLALLKPDAEGILALREAALDDRADRAAVLAQATVLSLSLSVPALLQQDGLPDMALPPGARRLELTGPARLLIEPLGSIDIAPAAGDRDRLLQAAQHSARRLRRLLDDADCVDLEQAERRSAERSQLVPMLEENRRALAAAAGPHGLAALRDQEAALRPQHTGPAAQRGTAAAVIAYGTMRQVAGQGDAAPSEQDARQPIGRASGGSATSFLAGADDASFGSIPAHGNPTPADDAAPQPIGRAPDGNATSSLAGADDASLGSIQAHADPTRAGDAAPQGIDQAPRGNAMSATALAATALAAPALSSALAGADDPQHGPIPVCAGAAEADGAAQAADGTGRDDAMAIAAATEAAQQAADLAQDAERAARAALHGPEGARDAARAALAEAELGVRTADNERIRLQAALRQARDHEADEALQQRLGTAERALSAANTVLAALIAAAPDGTVALADARIARLEQADRNRGDAQSREREQIARLEARIAAEEGTGLDEQIENAGRRQEEAARIVADNRREIAVLTLLRDTLSAADRTARERYLAPLVGRISPYLRALFPGASVALDERFLIAGLQRGEGGPAPEPEAFDTLSHGTREQVAILARLAFADMLAAGGHPSFLVLDDALAFADAGRMDRMFDILNEAGRRLQILVLTCREEVAARLGGHAVRLEPAGEEQP